MDKFADETTIHGVTDWHRARALGKVGWGIMILSCFVLFGIAISDLVQEFAQKEPVSSIQSQSFEAPQISVHILGHTTHDQIPVYDPKDNTTVELMDSFLRSRGPNTSLSTEAYTKAFEKVYPPGKFVKAKFGLDFNRGSKFAEYSNIYSTLAGSLEPWYSIRFNDTNQLRYGAAIYVSPETRSTAVANYMKNFGKSGFPTSLKDACPRLKNMSDMFADVSLEDAAPVGRVYLGSRAFYGPQDDRTIRGPSLVTPHFTLHCNQIQHVRIKVTKVKKHNLFCNPELLPGLDCENSCVAARLRELGCGGYQHSMVKGAVVRACPQEFLDEHGVNWDVGKSSIHRLPRNFLMKCHTDCLVCKNCRIPCDEVQVVVYSVTIQAIRSYFFGNVGMIADTQVMARIEFDDLYQTTLIHTSLKITPITLISNIGGTLGLCIGASMLSLIHAWYSLVRCIGCRHKGVVFGMRV